MGRPFIDLTGQVTEGGIYVKCVDPSSGGAGKHKKWICLCPICNQEFKTQSNHLINDKIESCANCASKKFEDLTGKNFYFLTVIKRLDEYANGVKYLCKCICGNYHTVDSRHLKSGSVKSCGCLKSSYEQTIKKVLFNNNISFEIEKSFKDCKDEKVLPFDFYIPSLNLLIEMQGEQHFKAVKFWEGEEGLKKRQLHDKIKEEYCKKKGIKLLQIAYYEDIEKRVNEEIVRPLQK